MATLPETWKSTIEEISKWCRTTQRVDFGHIQGPRASGKSTTVPLALLSHLREHQPDRALVYATNTPEAEGFNIRLAKQAAKMKAGAHLIVQPYLLLLDVLKTELKTGSRKLADRVVFVVDVDPWFTADFALFILLLAHWAGTRQHGSVRVLTMSCKAGHTRLDEWLKAYRPCSPRVFQLPADGSNNPLGDVPATELANVVRHQSNEDMEQHIVDQIFMSPEEKHLVVVFPEREEVFDRLSALDTSTNLDIHNYLVSPALVKSLQTIEAKCPVTVVYLPHTGPAPGMGDFDRAFIICASNGLVHKHHEEMRLVVERPRLWSYDQHLDQLSFRARVGKAQVSLHINEIDYAEFGQRGSEPVLRRVLEIDHRQLPGFICGLFDLSRFMDVGPALRTMARIVTYPVFRALCRLQFDGLLEGGQITNLLLPLPAFALKGNRGSLFGRILPVVGYDARLAGLLARSARDRPHVTFVKVQLAALLAVARKLFIPDSFARAADDSDLRTAIQGAGFGFVDRIAAEGTWWTVLALWNAFLRKHDFMQDPVQGTFSLHSDSACSIEVKLPDKRRIALAMDRRQAELLINCTNNLLQILRANNFQVSGPEAQAAEDECDLGKDAYNSLRLEVLKTFAFELVVLHEELNGCNATAVVPRCHVQLTRDVTRIVDIGSLRKGERVSFGVTDELFKLVTIPGQFHTTVPRCTSWTWIPNGMVHEWFQTTHGSSNPFKVHMQEY